MRQNWNNESKRNQKAKERYRKGLEDLAEIRENLPKDLGENSAVVLARLLNRENLIIAGNDDNLRETVIKAFTDLVTRESGFNPIVARVGADKETAQKYGIPTLKNWIGKTSLKTSGVKTLIVEGYPKAEDFKTLLETVEKAGLTLFSGNGETTDETSENSASDDSIDFDDVDTMLSEIESGDDDVEIALSENSATNTPRIQLVVTGDVLSADEGEFLKLAKTERWRKFYNSSTICFLALSLDNVNPQVFEMLTKLDNGENLSFVSNHDFVPNGEKAVFSNRVQFLSRAFTSGLKDRNALNSATHLNALGLENETQFETGSVVLVTAGENKGTVGVLVGQNGENAVLDCDGKIIEIKPICDDIMGLTERTRFNPIAKIQETVKNEVKVAKMSHIPIKPVSRSKTSVYEVLKMSPNAESLGLLDGETGFNSEILSHNEQMRSRAENTEVDGFLEDVLTQSFVREVIWA